MEYKMKPVVTASEIERAVKLQYDVTINLASLFWGGDFANDCYKSLCFDKGTIAEWEADECCDDEERREHLLVFSILEDVFPDFNEILVDINW